jgi:hypothetical protein
MARASISRHYSRTKGLPCMICDKRSRRWTCALPHCKFSMCDPCYRVAREPKTAEQYIACPSHAGQPVA